MWRCRDRDVAPHCVWRRLRAWGRSPGLGMGPRRQLCVTFGVWGPLPAKGWLLRTHLQPVVNYSVPVSEQILGWARTSECTREGTRVLVQTQELGTPAHVLKNN